jgi:hypothetical protein
MISVKGDPGDDVVATDSYVWSRRPEHFIVMFGIAKLLRSTEYRVQRHVNICAEYQLLLLTVW